MFILALPESRMSNHSLSKRPGVDGNADDWHGVQDPRKRKQIQDRLAQRARRMVISRPLSNTSRRPYPDK
ncbi:hypothetical protein AOQ84DRAFT_148145 [Glonium stellatum]|uniref:Uncharacterized protein n=1 Tax=Glonium stellatum TaxID=574774 RepID=A0A8E2F8W9_9PEZI|nr:hypothetical protein AOQ84DRAFT_148145 [Glonium stellatum]